MATITVPPTHQPASPPAAETPAVSPQPYRWTRAQYEQLAELGIFGPEERLELIEGEIIDTMPPMKAPHATGVSLAEEAARRIFPAGYTIRVQLPLALGERNEPEPDIAVVTGSARDYAQDHPTTALLVIEISDTTLPFDRTTKAAVYAKAGIQEYWIVNLTDRVLEVYRQPAPMTDQPLGYQYRSVTRYTETESVPPLAAPQVSLSVADLLP